MNHKKIFTNGGKDRAVFRNSTKQKKQLFISNGSRVINLLMKSCNLAFLQKKNDIGQERSQISVDKKMLQTQNLT
jgi:hypothetical protein